MLTLNDLLDWTIPKFRVKPKNIKQLMLPMIISGWLVGRGVLELPLGKRWPVASCIYSLFTILGYSFIAKVTVDDLNVVIPASSSMGIWIIQPMIWMDECVIIGSILNGWKSTKDVKNIIQALEACDRRVEKIGILRDYRSVYLRQLFTLIAELIFAISIMLYAFIWIPTNEQSLWHTVANTVCIYYPLIVVSVGDAQFITLVRSVALGFRQLNVSLKKLSTITNHSPQHQRVLNMEKLSRGRRFCGAFEKRTKDDSRVMREALQDHYELVRIATLTNATFGAQAFLSMALSSTCLLGLLYRCSALLLWSTLSLDILDKELGVILGWVVYYIYRIIVMTSACTEVLDECKKTATIICQLHEPSTNKTFRDEISDFLLQMTQNTIEFTAFGLFTLDRSFIQRIIVTISTYLVILVQLDGKTKSSVPTSSTSMGKNI